MNRSHRRLVFLFILAVVIPVLAGEAMHTAAGYEPATGNSSTATVRVEPANRNVGQGAVFTVAVSIQGAQDLGAFQFDLGFDPAIVQVNGAALAPFLGSTGRNTATVGPNIDNGSGLVRFGAFSYGSQPGPVGDGDLAMITMTAPASGSTVLDLRNVHLSDTTANAQAATVEDGMVTATLLTNAIPLAAGWNLISFNAAPTDTAPSSVLSPIAGKLIVAQSYDSSGKSYYPGGLQNTLTSMDSWHGYWLKLTAAATLAITGTQPAKTIPLQQGWNLIGYLPDTALARDVALASIAGKYTALLGYDHGAESWYAALPPRMNTLTTLKPGHGYWIYMTQAADLAYP